MATVIENSSRIMNAKEHQPQLQHQDQKELLQDDEVSALHSWDVVQKSLASCRPIIFLDYDGTLTPIVANPSEAIITDDMRQLVSALSSQHDVAIVTGRSIPTITGFMKLDTVYYAGSHGFDIRAPGGTKIKQVAEKFVPILKQFYQMMSEKALPFAGALVEDNNFSISVHYRNVEDQSSVPKLEGLIDEFISSHPDLVKTHGKMVFEVRPNIDWDKGKAVSYLLSNVLAAKDSGSTPVAPIYLGDDWTDEDAFKELQHNSRAITVHVRKPENKRPTAAKFILESTQEVQLFLCKLSQLASRL